MVAHTLPHHQCFWIWFTGIVSMTIDPNGEKKPQDEVKGIEDGVLVERQVSFQDRDLKGNAADEDAKDDVASSGLQGPGMLQVHHQQQQPHGTVVHWERFLHVRSIRVLLVENDDSTRHVVTALLRNCNYEVLEAGNGLQAWKMLEDLANHIDIVLTEVVMPFLSGIALLCKIMSHKTRKNVPVIMMSSHDSMGLVFKCLSKGAVDFLVKPIRKNELKNLWQHIWRRCHSSSGSGSEGTQTQKSVKSTSSQKSDNNGSDEKSDNNGSDDGENNGSTGLNVGDGSDDGSGTQSSWTKQDAEVDSSQAISPIGQVAECPDSTCSQVIHTNTETSGDKRVDIAVAREGHDQNQPDTKAKGKNLETIIPRNVKSKFENPREIPHTRRGVKLKSMSDIECNVTGKQIGNGELKPAGENLFIKNQGCSTKMSETLMEGKQSGYTGEGARTLDINKNATDDSKEPSFKCTLKRLRVVQDAWKSVQDDRYVLRHSEQSAFSRYNTSSNVFKAPNGITGSRSIIESVEVAERESVGDIQTHPRDRLVCQNLIGNYTNIDIGSTSNKLCTEPSSLMDKSEARSTLNNSHPSAFRPVNDLRCTNHQLLFNDIQATDLAPVRNLQQECNIQHPHNLNHHHHHNHFYNLEQPSSNHDELSQKKVAVDASSCGSTSVVGGPIDSNHPKNYSLNGSASGSNHGSNNFIIRENAESDVGQAGNIGSGYASGNGTRVDENKIARREAALNKFRQKRNERCFKKKVRYHNRKKLAEQRPRVRGQFVKQTGIENSNRNMDE